LYRHLFTYAILNYAEIRDLFWSTYFDRFFKRMVIVMVLKYGHLVGFVFAFLFCCAGNVWATTVYTPIYPDAIKEPWRWQTFSELNGLGLQCMAVGKDGAMWFGLNDGVMRYDGLTWKMYTVDDGLIGAPVYALCVAQNGDVYAGSDGGISCFRYLSQDEILWQRVFPVDGDLPWSINHIIESKDGSLWTGTAWGALNIRKDDLVLYTTEDMVASIRSVTPWLTYRWLPEAVAPLRNWRRGTGMRVVQGIAPLSAVVWKTAPDGPAENAGIAVGDRILAVNHHPRVTDNQIDGEVGSVVTLTVNRIAQSDTTDVRLTRDAVSGSFRDFPVYSVYEDASGNLWFGVGTRLHGGEVVRFQPDLGYEKQDAWKLFGKADELTLEEGALPQFVEDDKGHIWMISTHPRVGVQRFDGKQWHATSFWKFDQDKGLLGSPSWADTHTSIIQLRDGKIWVGGQGGRLHTGSEGVWQVYTFPDIPISEVRIVSMVADQQGVVWLAGLAQVAARLDYGSDRWQSFANLHFQCETPDGRLWFVTQQQKVVSYNGETWTQYGLEDGVIEKAGGLYVARNGTLWALGSHDGVAATGQFDGQKWTRRQTHPRFANEVHARAVFESANGDLWMGAGANGDEEENLLGGALQFDGQNWQHFVPPETPHYVYSIGQVNQDHIWLGGSSLRNFDGQKWRGVQGPEELVRWGASGTVDVMYTGQKGHIWLGTRGYGIFYYDGIQWTRYSVQNGLSDNTIKAIQGTDDGSIWVATNKGISRFDGHTWTTHALPPELAPIDKQGLRVGRDGAIWINRFGTFETVRYVPDEDPPETQIVEWVDEVTQPGNVTIAWQGADLWSKTAPEVLQYAWRLDGGAWSAFGSSQSKTLLELGSGQHTFEVKARDRDFNEDPTPAVITFGVIPPMWQQPWFGGLMMVLLGMIGLQTYRVITRDQRLQTANITLEEQNRDLSEARAAAEAASESKSAFLANMSHEIRTPLNAILGYARLLLRRGELGENTRQSIGTIESSGTHLLALINNILDLSRIESGRIELEQADFDLMALTDDIRAMFAVSCQEKGIVWQGGWYDETGQAVAPPEALHVYGDVNKLRQVLINLVGNAIKFAPGGHIHLQVSRLPDVKLPMHQNRYRFEVVDDGRGIHPEDQVAIFEPFEQGHHGTRVGGTGLGLAIARRYIQLMGGQLNLESALGKGSRFFFDLPLIPAAHIPQALGRVSEKQVVALAEGCVMDVVVVDDVLENRQVLSQVLIAIGATVRLASNGLEALDIIAEKMPDIVLMDIWMPEMDGQTATRRIKATYGDLAPPVVAVSASVLAHERTQFQAAGFDDFIAKPVHEARLFATLAKFLPVEYLYQEDVVTMLNLNDVVLPEDLYQELRQAVEFGEVTQLEDLIQRVRALGEATYPLSDQLWRLCRRLDLDAILKLLDEVKHGV